MSISDALALRWWCFYMQMSRMGSYADRYHCVIDSHGSSTRMLMI